MDLLWFMKFHVSGVRSDYILAILQAVSQQTVSYQNIYFERLEWRNTFFKCHAN